MRETGTLICFILSLIVGFFSGGYIYGRNINNNLEYVRGYIDGLDSVIEYMDDNAYCSEHHDDKYQCELEADIAFRNHGRSLVEKQSR